MNSVLSSVQSLMQMFDGKAQAFLSEIDNVHVVWLEEIQQEANRMFTRDFNAEPELMPKTPSQKRNTRRKRVSLGRQDESQVRRRFSKGRRSNLRGSSGSLSLNLIAEEETVPEASTSKAENTRPKRTTRKNKQTKAEVKQEVSQASHDSDENEEVQNKKPEIVEEDKVDKSSELHNGEINQDDKHSNTEAPFKIPAPGVVVSISPTDRLSAELAKQQLSAGRAASKIAIANANQKSRRSSVQCSLKVRHSRAGLRHSMTLESVRRASRRSLLKRNRARMGNSTSGSNVDEDSCMDSVEEGDGDEMVATETATEVNAASEGSQETPEVHVAQAVQPPLGRITRSVAANSPKLAPLSLFSPKVSTPNKRAVVADKQLSTEASKRSRLSTKRKVPDTVEESPTKRMPPPKKSQSAMKPHMKSFFLTVQKNQMLMMTPNIIGRSSGIKSFIKTTTPLRVDPKTKERYKLEMLKKKQEQEDERLKKMEEDKRKKQEELKRKRDERLRRVFEAKVKEEQKEEEKKKKFEQKMAQIEKNDKRQAEEKAKKKVAVKRQEELDLKRKQEEEARRKKLQQAEEEKRQQELLAKKKAEEEERARKQAEARRALELKREEEREKELERERQAAAERERVEREKALALQRELEKAAREKERRELEEKRKALEEKRKREEQQRLAAEKAAKEREAAEKRAAAAAAAAAATTTVLNQTVDIERSVMSTPVGKGGGLNVTKDIELSPQSYTITPKGGNKVLSKNPENYGMDQNSDDSTDDESAPRKPIPSWAEGQNLKEMIMKQYYNPPNLDSFFGTIEPPKLENIFNKSKPRYFKRTSSAVWNSPPIGSK